MLDRETLASIAETGIQARPELRDRIRRAEALVLEHFELKAQGREGKIKVRTDGKVITGWAVSGRRFRPYLVDERGCTCPDRRGGHICKHMLAARLMVYALGLNV